MACNCITHGAPIHRIMARDVIEEEMMCVWKGNGEVEVREDEALMGGKV